MAQFDFSSINEQLRKMAWIKMQDWLSRQAHERRSAYQEKELRGHKELEDLRKQTGMERLKREHELYSKRDEEQWKRDVAQDPTIKVLQSQYHRALLDGNQSLADFYQQKIVSRADELAKGIRRGFEGEPLTEEDVATQLGEMGPDMTREYGEEYGRMRRQAKDIPLEEQRLGIEERKVGVTERKEKGIPRENQEEYHRFIKDRGTKIIGYIENWKKASPDVYTDHQLQVERGVPIEEIVLDDKELADVVKEKDSFGKLQSIIERLIFKSRREKLSPKEEEVLQKAYSVTEALGAAESLDSGEEPGVRPDEMAPPAETGAEITPEELAQGIMAEAQRQGKKITHETALELARRELGK